MAGNGSHGSRTSQLLPQTTRRSRHRSSCFITVAYADVQPAMALTILPEILARTLVLRFFLLLTGAEAIVGLDALFEVPDERFIRIQDDFHGLPPILRCSDASPLQAVDPEKSWIPA